MILLEHGLHRGAPSLTHLQQFPTTSANSPDLADN